MNHEVRELIMPLQVEVSQLNDLRCLQAAEGYIELGMYDEADAENCKGQSDLPNISFVRVRTTYISPTATRT